MFLKEQRSLHAKNELYEGEQECERWVKHEPSYFS